VEWGREGNLTSAGEILGAYSLGINRKALRYGQKEKEEAALFRHSIISQSPDEQEA